MINLNPLPPAPTGDQIDGVLGLLRLISDPAAAKKRLDDLTAATKAATDAVAEALQAQAAAVADRDRGLGELDAARAAHEHRLVNDRAAFEAECAARTKSLNDREAVISDREAETKHDATDAAQLKADLNRRLLAIKQATE